MDLAKLDFAEGGKKPLGKQRRKQNKIIVKKDSTVILVGDWKCFSLQSKRENFCRQNKILIGIKKSAKLHL